MPRRRSRRIRHATIAALTGLALALGTAACTAGTAENGDSGSNGDGSSQSGNSSAYLKFDPCCSWGTTWSYNPYNVNGLGIQNDFVTLRLAIPKYPSLTDYIPQLSDKWTAEGNKLSVHLREDAKWQDGTPVTSKDFYDTVILNGTRGDGFWNDITDVATTDDHTVTFTLKKGQPIALAENDILGNIVVYPSSVYGKFVTDDLADDVKTYFRAAQKDPDTAGKTAAFKRVGEAFKKVAGYKVDKLIGDGPFQLDNITTKQAKLSKSDTFWDADKIKFGGIEYGNDTSETTYPQMLTGNLDLTNAYMPPPILKRWQATEDAHTALPLGFGFVLGFNNNKYPLNIKEVRQALAYVIPRQQMSDAAYGTDPAAGGKWKQTITGISSPLEEQYLSQDQLKQLNPYPVDHDKASELLKSKGFTQKNGQWMLPNGKPFTMSLTLNGSLPDILTSFNSAARALTAFGIKSDVEALSGAQQDANQHTGDFQAGMYFIGGNNPLGMYNAMMGPANNFSTSGNYAGQRGIGFGPKMDVPGLGNVSVPDTLQQQATGVAPGPKMKEYTWDWAQLVNEQVPYIWYATKVYQFPYLTKRFTNFPPMNADKTSPLWDIIANNMTAGVSLAIQQGYINPKS